MVVVNAAIVSEARAHGNTYNLSSSKVSASLLRGAEKNKSGARRL